MFPHKPDQQPLMPPQFMTGGSLQFPHAGLDPLLAPNLTRSLDANAEPGPEWDLSGIWHDFHGVICCLHQNGDRVALVGRNAEGQMVLQGEGRLSGDQLQLKLQFGDHGWGIATLILLPYHTRLGGTITNMVSGKSYGFMLHR